MNDKGAREMREGVHTAYSDAARAPEEKHPFPMGRQFAIELGYPAVILEAIPGIAVEAFTGVSNVSIFAEIPPGACVLDLGCGSGLDAIIASKRTGKDGQVIAVDFSKTMLNRAHKAIDEAGLDNILLLRADAESLPLHNASIDLAIVNGIFNLNPARKAIFKELSRVIRKSGRLYAAELILKEPLPPEIASSPTQWFA
jgi:SAM-dependent methyltransferase